MRIRTPIRPGAITLPGLNENRIAQECIAITYGSLVGDR